MNLKQLIKAKKLDYVNSNITEDKFPVPARIASGETEYKLFHFNTSVSSKTAIQKIEEQRYAPANLYELLSWEDWNEKDWVVALGSVAKVDGYRYVPVLYKDASKRSLDLSWFDGGWFGGSRFLAVRYSVPKTSESSEIGTLDSLTIEARVEKLEAIIKHHNLIAL